MISKIIRKKLNLAKKYQINTYYDRKLVQRPFKHLFKTSFLVVDSFPVY